MDFVEETVRARTRSQLGGKQWGKSMGKRASVSGVFVSPLVLYEMTHVLATTSSDPNYTSLGTIGLMQARKLLTNTDKQRAHEAPVSASLNLETNIRGVQS